MEAHSNTHLVAAARLCASVVAVLLLLSQSRGAEPTSPGPQPLALPRCVAPVDVGIERASDIESAVIRFLSGDTYQLTFKDCPDTTTQLYRALLDLGPVDLQSMGGDFDMLILNPKGGRTATLFFYTDHPAPGEVRYYVNQSYRSPSLDSLLSSLKHNTKAANLGAQIPFKVGALEVGIPSRPLVQVEVSSKEGKAVVAKARSIADSLDIRGALMTRVNGEIDAAIVKFGAVVLGSDEPVPLSLYELSVIPGKQACDGGYCLNIERKEVLCDQIIVMSYGNLMPPAVILRDKWYNHYLFNSADLTRREQEKRGVTEYGLPGHPVTDRKYYKSPADLYKELQELVRVAYKKGKAILPHTGGAYPFDRLGFPASR